MAQVAVIAAAVQIVQYARSDVAHVGGAFPEIFIIDRSERLA